jgi:hypothetical protein
MMSAATHRSSLNNGAPGTDRRHGKPRNQRITGTLHTSPATPPTWAASLLGPICSSWLLVSKGAERDLLRS